MGLWKKFTGEATFEEAEKRYRALKQRVEEKYREYKRDYDNYAAEIDTHVSSINKSKVRIKTELFPKMAHMMCRIKEYRVSETFDLTKYEEKGLAPIELRRREELYKIDFDKHRFKSNFLAVVTLGFATRKRAKETLDAVIEEEKRAEYDLERFNAQITKLKVVNSTLRNIDEYFLVLVEIYEALLERLDSSVKMLYVNLVSMSQSIIDEAMSIDSLPLVCQREIRALVDCSKILKHLVETKITVCDDSNADITAYKKDIANQKNEIERIYKAA